MKFNFKIKKGSHFDRNYLMRFLLFFYKPFFTTSKQISYKIIFNSSCLYKSPQDDINKLFGFSTGSNHMENSIRFGWRNLFPSNTIEIFAFYHIGGQFKYRKMCTVDIDKPYVYNCRIEKKGVYYFYTLTVFDNDSKRQIGEYKSYLFHLPDQIHFSYHLFPYFGGDLTAPHDMNIGFEF